MPRLWILFYNKLFWLAVVCHFISCLSPGRREGVLQSPASYEVYRELWSEKCHWMHNRWSWHQKPLQMQHMDAVLLYRYSWAQPSWANSSTRCEPTVIHPVEAALTLISSQVHKVVGGQLFGHFSAVTVWGYNPVLQTFFYILQFCKNHPHVKQKKKNLVMTH